MKIRQPTQSQHDAGVARFKQLWAAGASDRKNDRVAAARDNWRAARRANPSLDPQAVKQIAKQTWAGDKSTRDAATADARRKVIDSMRKSSVKDHISRGDLLSAYDCR